MNPNLRSPAAWLPRTPFWSLVAHFVKRMFSAEGDEGDEGFSLGLGVVIAILASPGAFASIFMLDKYSTLLQWLRGQRHFDFYKASAADEYFFVVLSMTVTGLVMVMRWNRLFPDRRDFWNLAALPIPIRHVFLANFTALLGLALLFAVDVNAVSSFLFPIFVTVSDGRLESLWRIASGHVAAVFSASLFSFFAVFALVGLLMLLVPGRWFRAASVAMRVLLVVCLLAEFFSNLFLQLLSGRLPAQAGGYMKLLPSFWFLGLYERVAGFAKPAMVEMSYWALEALAAAVIIAIAAYTLCYRRHFLRLAESFDSLGAQRRGARLRMPEWLGRLLFRSPFEKACDLFALKVLTRSERHVMFLGGYLGIGLILVAQTVMDDIGRTPLLLAFFLISGLRFAFDIPATVSANWTFRTASIEPRPSPNSIARRFMLLAVLPFELLPFGPRAAIPLRIGIVIVAVELVLLNFHKIPFTYSVQQDSRKMVARFVLTVLAMQLLVPLLSWIVNCSLVDGWRYAIVAVLVTVACGALYGRRVGEMQETALTFEERAPSEFELLKLA